VARRRLVGETLRRVSADRRRLRLIVLPTTVDERGALTYLEGERDIPFRVQRIYYLYGVRGQRAGHAHRHGRQEILALRGAPA